MLTRRVFRKSALMLTLAALAFSSQGCSTTKALMGHKNDPTTSAGVTMTQTPLSGQSRFDALKTKLRKSLLVE